MNRANDPEGDDVSASEGGQRTTLQVKTGSAQPRTSFTGSEDDLSFSTTPPHNSPSHGLYFHDVKFLTEVRVGILTLMAYQINIDFWGVGAEPLAVLEKVHTNFPSPKYSRLLSPG